MNQDNNNSRWWQIWFKIKQPPAEKGVAYPFNDLIIAHRILQPIINNYNQKLDSWHFHRRWKNDETGHLFNFFIKSEEMVKDTIFDEIEESKTLKILKDNGLVQETGCYEKLPNQNGLYVWGEWPQSINRNFPLFVHSLSKLWLDMIDEIQNFVPTKSLDPENIDQLQVFYQQIEANLNNEWLYRGAQFTYHYVSGIFGYSPTLISPDKMRGFLMAL